MNNHRLEINDLIDSAVNNAVARRNEALASVSDEEAKNVSGGIAITTSVPRFIKPIICGIIIREPITIGLIANRTPN
ncbi:hypothetical protein [Dolichospermum circinale]|uniref:hypothetical protein n=1 Tax=Dolichospermum circinale TaxID=109265 RepID=UPI00041A3BDB|nr:hypothetical protein [Dolichospermum circinale]MDB9467788.1 hypothetical protein [Dolichospermum circinale CS-539/09]MDB9469205.1 hypothetical protein [Dolichospermum circinale CS-539]